MTDTKVKPSLAELEATLQDQTKVAALVKEGKFAQFVTDLVDAKNATTGDLTQIVKEQTEATLAAWLKDNQAAAIGRVNVDPKTGIPNLSAKQAKVYNRRAPGAQLDSDFADSAEYFQAIWHNVHSLQNAPEMIAKQEKARKIANSYGSTVPGDGGFLIPETLRSEILSIALESAIVRPRARVIPMETLRVPIPAIDSTSNASSVFGGIVCYWTEEGASLVESQASFGRVVLDAKKLTGYAEMPNELISDASAFNGFFDQMYPQAMAWYEDDAFLNGSGVGMPLGFRNGSAKVTVTQAGGTPNIVWADVTAMYARMLPTSLNSAVWLASIDTFPTLASMELSSGSPAVWLNNGLAGGPPMTLLGRPVIFTEKVPGSGSAGQLAFVDFNYYLIGDRQVMQASSSPHYKFANDKTAFRIIERVDGRPWLNSAITPKNNTATLSPYVELGASN
jgi:HK97 family phage major capsid protein